MALQLFLSFFSPACYAFWHTIQGQSPAVRGVCVCVQGVMCSSFFLPFLSFFLFKSFSLFLFSQACARRAWHRLRIMTEMSGKWRQNATTRNKTMWGIIVGICKITQNFEEGRRHHTVGGDEKLFNG